MWQVLPKIGFWMEAISLWCLDVRTIKFIFNLLAECRIPAANCPFGNFLFPDDDTITRNTKSAHEISELNRI